LLYLLSSYLISSVKSFATPNSDFLLGIDGASMVVSHSHHCILEQKIDQNIGGRPQCWGSEHYGKLNVPKNLDFVQLVGGFSFSCGIAIDQTVHCWGSISGQIPGLYEQITAPDDGYFGCGVLIDGKINCWGHSRPAGDMPLNEDHPDGLKYVQISCSNHHCCVLDSNAYPHCFGDNVSHELNIPTITYEQYLQQSSEYDVDDVDDSNRGSDTTRRLKYDRSGNEEEEEDFEVDIDEHEKLNKPPILSAEVSKVQFRQLSVTDGYSCGITLLGSHLQCWGLYRSHLGRSDLAIKLSNGPYRQLSTGHKGICVIYDNTFQLQCWGYALTMSQLREDTMSIQWDQISVGYTSVCGVTMDSELICFGATSPDNILVA